MARWFFILAVASLVPMLFMPMNTGVHPIPKLLCKVFFFAFLLLGAFACWMARHRDAR
jgi:hypothetical protein